MVAVVGACRLTAQPADSVVPSQSAETAVTTALEQHGTRAAAGRVVVYVPADTLSAADAEGLAARLDRGLEAIEAYTDTPHAWQRKAASIAYYFPPNMFVSYTQPLLDRVFISFPRLGNGDAPLLHETVHAVLAPTAEYMKAHPELIDDTAPPPVWLAEGLAYYVGGSVAAKLGVRDGDPLNVGPLEEVDATCAKALGTPAGAEIAPFIGTAGQPEGLVSRARRRELAPPFYACAGSFTKHLVGLLGVNAVIDLLVPFDTQAALEAATAKRLAVLQTEWRGAIGARP